MQVENSHIAPSTMEDESNIHSNYCYCDFVDERKKKQDVVSIWSIRK